MTSNIKDYLSLLKNELRESDPAIIQDALSDAEEHLNTALDAEQQERPEASEEDLLEAIIEAYGTPEETAAAYREIEARVPPALAGPYPSYGNLLSRFFGVYARPQAWGALLYMPISLLTGILYFTWVVVGLSTSAAFALFIFGLPFAGIFLLSVRGVALVEGRIVEALLGVRMPRRALFAPKDLKWLAKIKFLASNRYTWLSMLYMILMLPLGILYFSLFVILIVLSLSFFAMPIYSLVLNLPVMYFGETVYYLPTALTPVPILLGLILMTATMHLAKSLGGLHGKLAKKILVVDQ